MTQKEALEILGLEIGFTESDLKKQFKILSKKYHPDSGNSADENRFILVQEAYHFLKDLKGNVKNSIDKKNVNAEYQGKVCPVCQGTGFQRKKIKTPHGYAPKRVQCNFCGGRGTK